MNWDDVKLPNVIADIKHSIAEGDIKVVSEEEAAAAEWRLCSEPPGYLKRSVEDFCSKCGRAVVYDPAHPKGEHQKLICIPCVMEMVKSGETL